MLPRNVCSALAGALSLAHRPAQHADDGLRHHAYCLVHRLRLDSLLLCVPRWPCRHCQTLESYVMASLVQLLCRTVKLAWMDHDTHRTIIDDCKVCVPCHLHAKRRVHCMPGS